MRGGFFARPRPLPSHIAALKPNSWISHQPVDRATLLNQQIIIEVLDLDSSYYSSLPGAIMNKISATLGTSFTENVVQLDDLLVGQWRAIKRDDTWTGKILIQCSNTQDTHSMYTQIHGTNVCLDGVCKTLDVSSPTNIYLANVVSGMTASSATQNSH